MRKNLTYQTLLLLFTGLSVMASKGICAEFLRGADISVQTKQEANGITYQEYGVPKDVLTILKNHDLNLIRVRLFHTPTNLDYGSCQDINYVTALGARAKADGFKFLLDIHYSDTWADPGKQYTPAAWTSYNHSQLVTAVHDYTQDVIEHLRDNNAMPDIVQIGNEITDGMLWPDGDIYNMSGSGTWSWDNFVELVNAGIQGVKDGTGSATKPEIMIHIDRGGDKGGTQWFLETFQAHGANINDVNIIGESFFPEWHGTLDDLTECLNYIAQNFSQDVLIAETAEYYTGSSGKNPANQKAFMEELIHRVKTLADANGTIKGRGVCYWEPTWVWESTVAYKALFEPIDSSWTVFNMLMGMEAFDILDGDSVLYERWTGITGSAVSDLTSSKKYPAKPASYGPLANIEGPNNWGDNYGSRIRGHLHPFITGDYTFRIASDGNSELWLSTNANPANIARIAYVPTSTDPCEWDKDANQISSAISLVAGEDYYIEVLHKAGVGSDNLAVAWEGPELTQQILSGQYISPYINIQKCTAKAGKTAGLDSIALSGVLVVSTGMLSDANNIAVKIYSAADDINYIVYEQNVPSDSFTRRGNTFSYKYKIPSGQSGGITTLSFDTNKNKFSLQTKNINLTGLECPLYLQVGIGTYSRIGFAGETIVNSRRYVPLRYMSGYKDTIAVTKAKVYDKVDPNKDRLSVKGTLTVDDDSNMADGLTITWGTQTFTVPSDQFTQVKTNRWKCKYLAPDGSTIKADFDFAGCKFAIDIKYATVTSVSGTVTFGLAFGDYDKTADVGL